jgi:alkylation response protein AidB-like acyl-CoA dehydrogenase
MIDFSLTEEQHALRELAHDFAEKEIRPIAWEYDREATFEKACEVKADERPHSRGVRRGRCSRHGWRPDRGRARQARFVAEKAGEVALWAT